jgi:hypothetical protein
MDYLKNFKLVSLGTNCMIKIYTKLYIDQPTYLFDWIGSPMWGINKLINDNFDMFNPDDYGPMKIYNNRDDKMFCNKKYFFRLYHDLSADTVITKTVIVNNKYGDMIKINYFDKFKEKYERRIEKFKELLNSKNLIVFLRLEEFTITKEDHEEYKILYSKSELEYIKEFMNILASKYPNLKYKLIYFSSSEKPIITSNLLILNCDNTVKAHHAKEVFDKVISDNIDIVKKFLN